MSLISLIPNIPDDTLLLAVLSVVAVSVIILFLKRKKDYYPKKDIDVEGPKEFADMIKTASVSVYREKNTLFNGPIKLGRITRMMLWHFDSDVSLKLAMAKKKRLTELRALVEKVKEKGGIAEDPKEMVDNFYLFEVIKDNLLYKILYVFGFGKNYHLVDKDAITEGYKQYSVNIYMQPQHWFKNVYIYSKMSKAVALNIADRLALKHVLNGVINFIPKMDYVEMKTANYVAKAREYQSIKDKSWKKREEDLEKEIES